MSRPDIPVLKQDLAIFNDGPCLYDMGDTARMRKRIYHALYYHNQGWQELSTSDVYKLRSMLARIKGYEDWYNRELTDAIDNMLAAL